MCSLFCLVCATSDALLIAAGVAGFSAIVEAWPLFPTLMRYAGAAFLIGYGAMRFRAAWIGGENLESAGKTRAFWPTILTCLAFTWANPHVYLDTLGLIGAISTQFPPVAPKLAFGIGAVAASFVFFFSLGYGARLLAPIMKTARSWQGPGFRHRGFDVGAGVLVTHVTCARTITRRFAGSCN